ncbi:baseplate J/gp47 family protein [Komagataeibacter rhaeticus]|nr:baseplate J/gp47 family protein [Komagataeibacter rhaeticus]
MLEAVAGLGLWFQFIALQILSVTRLATSIGSDVDSFVQDFGLTREAGTAATGTVTFTSFTPSSQSATIAVGTTVKTASSLVYDVVGTARTRRGRRPMALMSARRARHPSRSLSSARLRAARATSRRAPSACWARRLRGSIP